MIKDSNSDTAATSRAGAKRVEILAAAVDRASAYGLDGLTIGALATTLEMSKSGLFAHFGSKENLQIAAIEWEAHRFEQEIAAQATNQARGLPRLRALVDVWTNYVDTCGLSGGCFFASASAEFGHRKGAVRDRLSNLLKEWLLALAEEARLAVEQGELAADTNAEQLAFELHAYVQEANWSRGILSDASAFDRARVAVERTLQGAMNPRNG